MKVVVDDQIPYIKGVIETLADEVIYLPGNKITNQVLKHADALIIRTRTQCNQALLKNTAVQFIATATIGHDHIDQHYCKKNHITWCNAPGCNADSVTQYLLSSLLLVEQKYGIELKNSTIGIIGVGNVGSKVRQMASQLGLQIEICDPPRKNQVGFEKQSSLTEICKNSHLITFHTPLIFDGSHPTFHLADAAFFDQLIQKPFIINTSRGEAVDSNALHAAFKSGKIAGYILDVWENEPAISLPLLTDSFIGTPHIAGYSADGKANATRMVLDAFCAFFQITPHYQIIPPPPPPLQPICTHKKFADAMLETYNPMIDNDLLKDSPALFEQLRATYRLRREAKAYQFQYDDKTC